MSIKLIEKRNPNEMLISDMKDGQIGVITCWSNNINSINVGSIVQRYDERLIVLGKDSGDSFSTFFVNHHNDCFVRLLDSNDMLLVDNNIKE